MKLSKLTTTESEAKPQAPRTLSADECEKVSGGGRDDDYFTFYEAIDYRARIIEGHYAFRSK